MATINFPPLPVQKTKVTCVGYHGSATNKTGIGSGNVVRHSIVLSIGGRKIIFDPGFVQGSSGNDNLQRLSGVEAIIITHAHCDHWAGILTAAMAYPKVPIFCTPPTEYFIRASLSTMPGVDKEICKQILGRIRTVKYKSETGICGGLSFLFFSSGHMLGSAACLVKDCSAGDFLVTGDFSFNYDSVLPPFKLDDIIKGGRLCGLICEGSFVSMPEPNIREETEKCVSLVKERLEIYRPILFSVDKFGSAQNFLLYVMAQQRLGNIPCTPTFMLNQDPKRFLDGSEPLVKQLRHAWSHFFPYLSLEYRQIFDSDPAQFRKTMLMIEPTGHLSMGDTFSRSILAMHTRKFKEGKADGLFDTKGFGRDFIRSGGLVVANHKMDVDDMIGNLGLSAAEKSGAFLFPPTNGHPYARMIENLIIDSGFPPAVLVHGGQNNLSRLARNLRRKYGTKAKVMVASVGVPIEL